MSKLNKKSMYQADIPVNGIEGLNKINNMHKYFGIIIDAKHDKILGGLDKSKIINVLQYMIDNKVKTYYNEKENIYILVEGYTIPDRYLKFKKPIMIQVKASRLLKTDSSKIVTSVIAKIIKDKIVELYNKES